MVYLDPTYWPAPSWLVSSVGRALHRYRRGHGFKSRTGLNFFQVLLSNTSSVVFLAARISWIRFFTAVQIYEFHISQIIKGTWVAHFFGPCAVSTQNALESLLLLQPWYDHSLQDTYDFKSTKNPPSDRLVKGIWRWHAKDDIYKTFQTCRLNSFSVILNFFFRF